MLPRIVGGGLLGSANRRAGRPEDPNYQQIRPSAVEYACSHALKCFADPIPIADHYCLGLGNWIMSCPVGWKVLPRVTQ